MVYKRSTLYGSGDAGIKITKILEGLEKYVQKNSHINLYVLYQQEKAL